MTTEKNNGSNTRLLCHSQLPLPLYKANYAYLLKLANAFKINYVDTVKTTTNVLSLIKITSKELISAEQDTFCK